MYIDKKTTISSMSSYQKPCCCCRSGDVVAFQTLDCYSGNLRMKEDIDKEISSGEINPATGPVYVEGAEAGDILQVEVKRIQMDEQACMKISPGSGALGHLIKEQNLKLMSVKGGFLCFNDQVKIPVSPMIGVVGTAPPQSSVEIVLETGAVGSKDGISNSIPGEHGSNMDCTKIQEGTVLYLPVNVPGALLAIGDLHAVMGDGEVAGCAAEISGEVTVQVTVIKNKKFFTPMLVTKHEYVTIASAPTIDEAGRYAAEKMARFLEMRSGMSMEECVMLLSLVGDLEICQIVNPLKTARMSVPRRIFEGDK